MADRVESGHGFYVRYGKRIFDITLAILSLPVLLPVIALLWVLVRLDGGPGFFLHTRVGRNGKPFKCWKIRSMVVNAEHKLKAYLARNPEAAAEWERDFKLTDDPRVTRIGRFIRKTSLDEIPQIFNVLTGEMSFVGPRPIVTEELQRYGQHASSYMAMTPGVTGLWQVSGRNEISYGERIALDISYLEHCSLRTDLSIIWKTGAAVIFRTGK
nr:sugar transferase [Rhodovulum sp. P5]